MNFAMEGRDRDAVHRWPRERWLTLLRVDVPHAILSREHEWYSYCILGCRPKSNSTKTNTIIHRELIFLNFAYKNSHQISAVAYVQSEYCDSIRWQYELYGYIRYAGISVNMATQFWMKWCVWVRYYLRINCTQLSAKVFPRYFAGFLHVLLEVYISTH